MLWSGIFLGEAAHAYSLLREQMTSAERSALISKLFQGIWGEACENRLKPGTGTMETTTGSNKVKGTGTAFTKLPVIPDRWISLRDGAKSVTWYKIVSVESDTELTINKAAVATATDAAWFFEDEWKAGTCGALWKMGHHSAMSTLLTRVGASALSAAVGADDERISVANPAAFQRSLPFQVRIGTEWLKVTAISGNALTVQRGQFGTAKGTFRAGTTVTSSEMPAGGSYGYMAFRAPAGFPDFEGALDNKNHLFIYGLISLGLAFADDDPRARELLERSWNWWHDFLTYDQKLMGTGITRGGYSYFPYWTAFSHELTAFGKNSFVPAIDLSDGHWLRESQMYSVYGSLPWAPKDTVMYADSGGGDADMAPRKFRHVPFGFELFPDTRESRYSGFFYRESLGYWNTTVMGSASADFDISPRWLIYADPGMICPSVDCVDYRTLDPFHFFTETDAAGNGHPGNGYHVVVSRQDWTDKATMVWMSALGAPGDHQGYYSTPGAYRIGKGGVWLHASGGHTLDGTSTSRGSYVQVDTPASIALPATNRRNTLGTLGTVVQVDQKLGNRSAVYWRVNSNHAFQQSAAIRHHFRYFAHFNGSKDFLVVYDTVSTSSEKKKMRRVFCYTGDVSGSKAADVYKRTGLEISCSRPEATLLSRVVLPADESKLSDNVDVMPTMKIPEVSRFTALDDGATTESEFLVLHHAFAGTTGTLPPTQLVNSDNGIFRGLWIQDQTPRLALFPRTAQTQSRMAFTAPFQDEGQILIGGLNPGKYAVTRNGAALPGEFIVHAGEGALFFKAAGGKFEVLLVSSGVPLAVNTTNVLPGIIGQTYSFPLVASGGIPPYRWSLVSGNLPAGLSLDADGVIAGVPEREESTEITVQVTDQSTPPEVQQAAFTIAVTKPPPEALTISLDSITSSMVGLKYGRPSLPQTDSCNVTLALDDEYLNVVDDFFDQGGPPFRDLTFGWSNPLSPGTRYYIRARCADDIALAEFETPEDGTPAAAPPPPDGSRR